MDKSVPQRAGKPGNRRDSPESKVELLQCCQFIPCCPNPSLKFYIAAIQFQSSFQELVSMTLMGSFQLGTTYDTIPFSSQHVAGSSNAAAQLAELSFPNKWWHQRTGSSAHRCLSSWV